MHVCVFNLPLSVSFRYRAIVRPLDVQTSTSTTSIVLQALLIWVLSLILAIPEAVFSDLHTFNITSTNESFVTCAPYPHGVELHPQIHSMASFLIFYIIPLLVISVYYSFMAQSLMRSTCNLPVEGNVHARRQASVKFVTWQAIDQFRLFLWHESPLEIYCQLKNDRCLSLVFIMLPRKQKQSKQKIRGIILHTGKKCISTMFVVF